MKQHGILGDLCRSLDCMEDEMHGLCRLFSKKRKPKHKGHHPPCFDFEAELNEMRALDFCPPCGRSCPCCQEKKNCDEH